MNKFTARGLLVKRDFPFHRRNPSLTETPTADEMRCALMVLDALNDIEIDDGTSLFALLRSGQGTCEAREEVFAMGIYIERLYTALARVYGDNVSEIMLDIWGCYDLEWVPEMAVMLIEEPCGDLFKYCASKIDALLEKTKELDASSTV
tara:strand:+ start:10579 stop:11025 length:447 start_codon:yes stop_codon:yes gene_type:complete